MNSMETIGIIQLNHKKQAVINLQLLSALCICWSYSNY